jgi:hypothetical protein
VVTYWQWRTAHQKVVLDLFDRRFKVFEEVMGVICRISRANRAAHDDVAQLREAKARAQFLFGSEIEQFLVNLLQQIEDRQAAIDSMHDGLPVGPERTEYARLRYEATIALYGPHGAVLQGSGERVH